MKTHIGWQKEGGFNAQGVTGYTIKIDDSNSLGDATRGARPMELLLHALGACSGMYILTILKKMRVELTHFTMELEGKKAHEKPGRFEEIHVRYILKGKGLNKNKVEKVIDLSDQYCSVRASLNAHITSSYEFEDFPSEPDRKPIP